MIKIKKIKLCEISMNHIGYHCGGNCGGFGRFMAMFGALRFDGSGPVGGTRVGWLSIFKVGGCIGTCPGLLIEVAFPGFLVSVYVFLNDCEGGASAVSDTIFSPLTITSPSVLLICFKTPVFLALVILY